MAGNPRKNARNPRKFEHKKKNVAEESQSKVTETVTDAGKVTNIEIVLPKHIKPVIFPHSMRGKARRQKLYAEYMKYKKQEKDARRAELRKLREAHPELKNFMQPQTIDSKRITDETMVQPDDDEIQFDLDNDELSAYFKDAVEPKIAITTTLNPLEAAIDFATILTKVIPNMEYFPRGEYALKEIIGFCKNRSYTDLIVINEDNNIVNTLMHVHLPYGPTALYKVTSLLYPESIPNVGKMTSHPPELILNDFNTRLGLNLGRMLALLFPQQPDFHGRRAITLHNQRDFVFFRHHRYVFRNKERAGIQELGPSFTLKLKSLQAGTFDSKNGEVEFTKHHEDRQSRNRLKFAL